MSKPESDARQTWKIEMRNALFDLSAANLLLGQEKALKLCGQSLGAEHMKSLEDGVRNARNAVEELLESVPD